MDSDEAENGPQINLDDVNHEQLVLVRMLARSVTLTTVNKLFVRNLTMVLFRKI
jgi:hypothetical protein